MAAVDFINQRVKALKEQARREVETAVLEAEESTLRMKADFEASMQFQSDISAEAADQMGTLARRNQQNKEVVKMRQAAIGFGTEAEMVLDALPKTPQAELYYPYHCRTSRVFRPEGS